MEQNMLEAHKLQAEGRTQKEIAEILGVTDRTVRNYLREAPRKRKPPIRTSKLDPYREFIRGMLKDHPRMNGELILEHITRMGYTGKRSILKAYLTEVRKELS